MRDNHVDDDGPNEAVGNTLLDIRNLSQIDLGRLGLQQIAYVKPVMINGVNAFAIHAADGTLVPTRAAAFALRPAALRLPA